MRSEDLFAFIEERYSIHKRRKQGVKKPWTRDKILQSYRFCNVYRELDTQTMWLANNWRIYNDPDFWFAALVFRFVNWHESAEAIGYPVPWVPATFKAALKGRHKRGEQMFSGAYMISTHGVRQDKPSYLATSLTKIWEARKDIRWRKNDTLNSFHDRLMGCFDVGSFIAAQVIADAKYEGPMKEAPDWWSFAASGPGSRRGLNRVIDRPVDAPYKEDNWRLDIQSLGFEIDPLVKMAKMPRFHAQDLQNCLCEFDKYERVRLGEGRPKSLYQGV